MEEQPPTEAPSGSAKSTPRPRTPKAAFTPPETTTDQDPPVRPVSRSAKAAPVLFQPPPEERPPGGSSGPVTDGAPAAAPVPPADVAAVPAKNAGRKAAAAKATPTKKAATRKAAPKKEAAAAATTATPEKKVTPTKKAAPAKKTAPSAATREVPPPAPPGQNDPRRENTPPVPETVPGPPAARRLLAHPGYAPELLALAAVRALAPHARAWADELRATYPAATAHGLARLATRRFTRLASAGGAVSSTVGPLAPLAELTVVAWTQAALVLHLAAAYGFDPGHPDRAVDLLVLTQVHPTEEIARAALAAAADAPDTSEPAAHRAAEAIWRLAVPLAAQTGGWLALRLASRLVPGAAPLAAAAGDAAAAERLAARTVARYRVRAN